MVPGTRNLATYMKVGCSDKDQVLTDIVHFGMAYKNFTTTGFNGNVTVRTIDKCSYGLMKYESADWNLEKAFEEDCLGKRECLLFLNLEKVMDKDCQYEMRRRINGFQYYGPPKLFFLSKCSQQTIKVGDFWEIGWERASKVVVWIDILTVFVFVLASFRLKYYQDLVTRDFKDDKFTIDDFSILIKSIPVSPEEYDNCPELLTAMMATHLEDILRNEMQSILQMQDMQ